MGRIVVRRDEAHSPAWASPSAEPAASSGCREPAGLAASVARVLGSGKSVWLVGAETSAFGPMLEARQCRVVLGSAPSDTPPQPEGAFDAIIVADLPGRIDDAAARFRRLKGALRPDGVLIVTIARIAPIDGRLAIVGAGPLGRGSGVHFTEEGLLRWLEDAQYAIAHVERTSPGPSSREPEPRPDACRDDPEDPPQPALHGLLIVAMPLPVPGLDAVQARMRALARTGEEARRQADSLRLQLELANQQIEIRAGHERRMADRIRDLRGQLLAAHAEMIRRDDEIRKTFGDAIFLRNSLLIERDTLLGQREELVAERAALIDERDALRQEREALRRSLQAAESRLNLLRSSPMGLALRVARRLSPRRGGVGY